MQMQEFIEQRLVELKAANETGTYEVEYQDFLALQSAANLEDGDVFEDLLDEVCTEVYKEVLEHIADVRKKKGMPAFDHDVKETTQETAARLTAEQYLTDCVLASLKEHAKDEGGVLSEYEVDQNDVHSILKFNTLAATIASHVNEALKEL